MSAGPLGEFVENLGWWHWSDVRAPAMAFPRKRDREISRPRDDLGAESALAVTSARRASPRLLRRSRCSFCAILEIDANHIRRKSNRAAATTEKIVDGRQPNCGRAVKAFAARTPNAPSCGPDCRTSIRQL
jgi:hypothetical protein